MEIEVKAGVGYGFIVNGDLEEIRSKIKSLRYKIEAVNVSPNGQVLVGVEIHSAKLGDGNMHSVFETPNDGYIWALEDIHRDLEVSDYEPVMSWHFFFYAE